MRRGVPATHRHPHPTPPPSTTLQHLPHWHRQQHYGRTTFLTTMRRGVAGSHRDCHPSPPPSTTLQHLPHWHRQQHYGRTTFLTALRRGVAINFEACHPSPLHSHCPDSHDGQYHAARPTSTCRNRATSTSSRRQTSGPCICISPPA